jgi:hypothetical protein
LVAASLSSTHCTSPSSSIRTKFTTYETQSFIASGSPIISKYQKSDNQKYHSSIVTPTKSGPLKSQKHFFLPFLNQTSSSINLSNLQKSVPINQSATTGNSVNKTEPACSSKTFRNNGAISGSFYSPLYSSTLRTAVTLGQLSPSTSYHPIGFGYNSDGRFTDYRNLGFNDRDDNNSVKSSHQDFLSLSLSLSPPLNRKNREMPSVRGMISL